MVDDPTKPMYASPWDKPIGHGKGSKLAEPVGPAPRNANLSELLNRAGIAAAGGTVVSSPSPWEPGEPAAGGDGTPRDPARLPARPSAKSGRTDWSIAIANFDAETEAAAAEQALRQVRSIPGLAGATLENRGRARVIVFGSYDAPGSPAARKDLERIRALVVGGTTPFRHALLSPPSFEAIQGSVPDYELRSARNMHGKDALYTLQLGVYWRQDGEEPTAKELAEFRAAAEKAAVELRREGEEAYYYHGSRKSMVTVGVFDDSEYDASPQKANPMALPNQSARLLRLRAKFPYNLENGMAVKRRQQGQEKGRIDPSFVVMIPK